MAGNRFYDVFLSHTSADKDAVEAIARRLEDEAALSPFLDKWHLIPGNPWQEELEQALDTSRTCAVFIGPHGIGPWENVEMRSALDDRVKRSGFRVIPVLLPGAVLPERGTLPRFLSSLTWVDFRSGLQDAETFRRLLAGIRGQPPGRTEISATSPQDAVCPYQGLAVFDEADAPFFFGREADTQHLLEQLRTQRFLAVIGPSGSGKSSIVRAGVLPKLRQGALQGSEGWTYLMFHPGAYPLDALAVGLAGLKHQNNIASLRESLAASERELYLQTRLLLQTQPDEAHVCLIVDQFEEVFTLCQDQIERTQFMDALRYAATVAGSQSVILLTMRADFLTRAAEYKPFAELLSAHPFLIGPMDRDDLHRACEEPAHRVGLTLENGLTEAILDDVGREPGLLPLMQDALLQLWERRRADQVMTLQAYLSIGGVRGALAKKADTLFTTLSQPRQTIARRVFLRLTQPGEGTEDTRRRATRAELRTTAEETGAVADVIQILADARLLVTSEDQQVDVAHEALIRGWPRLRGWIEEDRSALRTHRRLTEAAEEWQRLQRDQGVLFRGTLLTVAQEWRQTHDADLNLLERDFLDASVALRHQEEAEALQQQRREQEHLRVLAAAETRRAEEQTSAAKRSRRLATLAFCVALAAVAAGLFAGVQWRRVAHETQRANIALAKHYWASAVNAQAAGDVLRAAHFFARSGALRSDPSEVHNALFAVHNHLKSFFLGFQLVHGATVRGVVFSEDEQLILSWGDDDTVRLWQATDGAAVAVMKHERGVSGATFNRDGSRVLSWGDDDTVRLWQATDGAAVAVMKHEGGVSGATFNRDESRVLSWGEDGAVRLWQATDGAAVAVMKHEAGVSGATFNRDESRVLSWGEDGAVRLWQATDGAAVAVMKHEGGVWGATFNRDGSRVLSWGEDGAVRLWQATDGAAVAVMKHERGVRGATFNRDESRVLSWGSDGAVRLWQATDGAAVAVMKHGGRVSGATFNGDESRVLSWGEDGAVRLWQATDGAAVAVMKHGGRVSGATFNGDESRVLSWGEDGAVRLWDIQADFDLPRDHIRLLVEVVTGTVMDDVGNVSALHPEEWTKRKKQYQKVAEQHLITCQYGNANLYLRQKRLWGAGE